MNVSKLRETRLTQAQRRARSRDALLETAARGLSHYGNGNLKLEQVARDAGYTRGALYHQFRDKEDLALAVVEWVDETWKREVGDSFAQKADPAEALLTLARSHAVFCRRDISRVMMALRIEFVGQDHPVGREIVRVGKRLNADAARLINAGRRARSIPPGPPAKLVAASLLGGVEGVVMAVGPRAPHDEVLAERVAAGVLGLRLPISQLRAADRGR
jgi:AcrR family transcriptional regulator